MRMTREVLKKLASRVRNEIKEELAEDSFHALAFFYNSKLESITEFFLHSADDEAEKDVIKSLKKLRQDMSPSAVAVVYAGEIIKGKTRKEADAIQSIPDHPKRKAVIIIEVSSRTAHYEVMIEFTGKGKTFGFGKRHETVPGEGCVYTRRLWDKTKKGVRKRPSSSKLSDDLIQKALTEAGRTGRIDWDVVLNKLADLEEGYGAPLVGNPESLRKIDFLTEGGMTARKADQGQTKKAGEFEYRLVEGVVDTEKEHIGIWYGDDTRLIALIAPAPDKTFIVQYLIGAELFNQQKGGMLEKVRRDINFFLVEKGEKDPWAYAKYHCGTAANVHSRVHWGFIPAKTYCPRCEGEAGKAEGRHKGKKVYRCPSCGNKYLVTGNITDWTCMEPGCKKAKLRPDPAYKAPLLKKAKQKLCDSCKAEIREHEAAERGKKSRGIR